MSGAASPHPTSPLNISSSCLRLKSGSPVLSFGPKSLPLRRGREPGSGRGGGGFCGKESGGETGFEGERSRRWEPAPSGRCSSGPPHGPRCRSAAAALRPRLEGFRLSFPAAALRGKPPGPGASLTLDGCGKRPAPGQRPGDRHSPGGGSPGRGTVRPTSMKRSARLLSPPQGPATAGARERGNR